MIKYSLEIMVKINEYDSVKHIVEIETDLPLVSYLNNMTSYSYVSIGNLMILRNNIIYIKHKQIS
jgi:hypothetical protein